MKFAPVYYDEEGNFHAERRLGCMCCPLASKKHRIEEFKKWPNMVKLYIKAIQQYMDSHPDSKMVSQNGDAYGAFVRDIFYNEKGKWAEINSQGLFDMKVDYKAFLEKQFGIDLTFSQK